MNWSLRLGHSGELLELAIRSIASNGSYRVVVFSGSLIQLPRIMGDIGVVHVHNAFREAHFVIRAFNLVSSDRQSFARSSPSSCAMFLRSTSAHVNLPTCLWSGSTVSPSSGPSFNPCGSLCKAEAGTCDILATHPPPDDTDDTDLLQ